MRRPILALLAVLALALAAAGLSACGSSTRLIPASEANRMDDQLQNAADASLAGDCPGATAALAQAQATFRALPPSVDQRLRARIEDGLRSLVKTLPVDCAAAALPSTPVLPTTGTTGTTDSTTTSTTTPTTTTTTTTPTTAPTTTTTTPTTPAPPVGGISPDAGTTTGQTP